MEKILIIICSIVCYLLSSFVLSKIFRKANVNSKYGFIPLYRSFKLLNLADLKWYYIFGLIISPANLFFAIYYSIKLGKKFHKSNGFIIGLLLLPVIFYPVLAFDKSKYDAKVKYTSKNFIFTNATIMLLTFVVSAILLIPTIFNNITKGLDLAGGFEILYQIKSADGKKVTKSQVEDTYRTMLRRIDKLGVSEPEIIIEGNDKIRVKLAGVKNPDEARKYITVAGELSFRDSSDKKLMDKSVLKEGSGAKVSTDESGRPAILLNIADKDKFYSVTSSISQTDDQLIVIWLDYDKAEGDSYKAYKDSCGDFDNLNEAKCLSAATVKEGFSSNVIIQGNFSEENAKNLVDLINSGSTNVKFKEISSKTVGSEFGEDSLSKTQVAAVIGVTLIALFMCLIYRFSGFLASSAVLIYTFSVLLIFYLIDGVLTLPGIAALVLGVGMAVDANVITCERIKEELENGKSLKNAFINGNKNSFSSIFDSNITTLIVALILFAFGESSVKGFATMLIINIIMTMLIVIFINRAISKQFVNSGFFDNRLKLFVDFKENKNKKENKFSFVKHFKKFLLGSLCVFTVGIIIAVVSGFNIGIDFSGGSDITISTKENVTTKQIKDDLKELKLTYVDYTNDSSDNALYIKVANTLDENEVKKVNKYFSEKYNAKTEIAVVSNVVKKDLIKNALISLLFAIIGIIIYISIRYKKSYAYSAVIALMHDVLIIVAMFSIFKVEINTMFVAAILTIIGYSINNTIVIFDRIRENMHKHSGEKNTFELLEKVVDSSVRSTFNRSINTTLTTLFPIICLMIFGAKEINEFNIAVFIGLLAGAYSSVLLSSQIWMRIENKHNIKEEKKKKSNPKKSNKQKKRKVEELTVKGINA